MFNSLKDISMFISIIYVIKNKISEDFKYEFVKSPSINVIILPIIVSFISEVITTFSRMIPAFYGYNVIGIGSNQALVKYNSFTLSLFIFCGLIPAIIEETFFRFFSYIYLKKFLKFIVENRSLIFIKNISNNIYTKMFINKKFSYNLIWILIISTIFAMAHGPNIYNFYLYFIPGVIFGVFYFKYGLLSAILAHAFGNYFSPPVMDLIIYIINMFVK
ncbi:CPBP family intramembrane glutamic endopeptidase [Candidatus Sarcina troglodytae]|nr:CPBP family intramembrane glutamic endopeptidase [Sarcina sp. JB2]